MLAVPTLHNNGSAYETLRDGYIAAIDKVREAATAIEQTAPNQRDYYVQPIPGFTVAVEQYAGRYRALQQMVDDLTAIVIALDEQESMRTR